MAIIRHETTQADWQQGTLDGVVATAAGDLELAKILATDDFERVSIGDNWVEQSPSVPRWSIDAGRLKSDAVTVNGYNSILYTAMDVSGVNIVIEYDVYFSGKASRLWGGFDYRGVGVDVNPVRTGIRNGPEFGEEFGPGISVGVWHHVKAVITVRGHPNDELKLYVDGNLIITDTFRAPYTSPYVGLRSTNYTDDDGYALYDNFLIDKGYLTSGTRTSPPIDLSPVGTAAGSSISWTATTPTGTSVIVEVSLDGGATWHECTNGGTIPGLSPGDDLTGASLLVRQTLITRNASVTPTLSDLTVTIGSLQTATATAQGGAADTAHATLVTSAAASTIAVATMDWNERIQAVSATAMAGATLDVAAIRMLIQALMINAIIQPGDIVEIDTAKMTVKINGVNALRFMEGDFFALSPGTNHLEYQDSEQSREVQIITRHRPRWL